MNLRPYQTDTLADVTMAFASGAKRVLLVLPTAAGKTVVFSHLAQRWTDHRTAVVAHRRELIRQASAKLAPMPHGTIAPGHPYTRYRVQVGSIQTMARRLPTLPKFGLIVADEAHHTVAGQWRALLDAQPDALVLGVTATPERLDGRGLGDVFDTLIVGPSIADLTDDGYLSRGRVWTPPTDIDFARIRQLAGDFNPAAAVEAMDRPTITGDAVEHYRRHASGQPAIAFCVSVAHAEHVAEQFRAGGFRSVCVHGGLDAAVRDARIAGLGTGDVQVLTSCDLISEGLDVPAVSAVILLRPTQSLAMFLQMVGRGMRPVFAPGFDLDTRAGRLAALAASGKPRLTVLDHAGNTLRHGLPDAPREWTLDGIARKKRAESIPAVRQCPSCYAAHAPAPVCPACGHRYHADADSLRKLTAVDGELVEHVAGGPVVTPLREALEAAETWDDIEAIRTARGYKPGWTATIMAHRRGRRRRDTTAAEDFGGLAA